MNDLIGASDMARAIAEEKEKSGYSKKLYKGNNYKAASDEHKGALLASDIRQRAEDLLKSNERGRVNFKDIEDVQTRIFAYFSACAAAEVYPSVMGLAVHGFGISRQALNQYLLAHAETEAAEEINKAKDVMADILTNASLYNNANAVQALFQLKNHFGHSDRVEVQPVETKPDNEAPIKRILGASRAESLAALKSALPGEDFSGLSDEELIQKRIELKYPQA